MIIKFPDGRCVDTATQSATPTMSSSGPIIFFVLPDGTTMPHYFVFSTAIGQITAINEIYMALAAGEKLVELFSDAGLPTGANSTPGSGTSTTDMYVNNSVTTPTPVSANGGDSIYLVIGSTWPPPQSSGPPSLAASFQPDAQVTIGGIPVTNLKYINGVTLLFQTPQIAPGTYDMVYSDGRGSVTKVASFIFS